MGTLPSEIVAVLAPFAPFFRYGIWPYGQVLVIGAILAPGKRTVTSVLWVMGLSQERQFQKYHRVLNRSPWSSLVLSRVLLTLLVAAFVPAEEPIVLGLDETIERRRGEKIAAKGIYRDAVRSSKSHFVKASGLRWVSMMLIAPIPWASRFWALPFLTALAPSARYYEERARSHKRLTDWARQMITQARRWLPQRKLVVVGDGASSTIELLAHAAALAEPVTMITRLRLDAARYDPPPLRTTTTRGRPRLKGKRQPTLSQHLTSPSTSWQQVRVPWYGGIERLVELATGTALWYHNGLPPVALRWVLIRDPLGKFEPQALLATDQSLTPHLIVAYFVRRWRLEVTFEEVRAHLGVETQRQWSDLAIARTTPALLALFSLVTLFAHHLLHDQPLPPRQAAWYTKQLSTFSDTLAFVRSRLWPSTLFSISLREPEMVKIPRVVLDHFTEMLAFAA
ncbi:MAG: transposase [Ardenticatenaceae bacterium]|nr:transposase [Ardenticatenaceae bacterium]